MKNYIFKISLILFLSLLFIVIKSSDKNNLFDKSSNEFLNDEKCILFNGAYGNW